MQPTISIQFSREMEIDRVSRTLKNMRWYREHGYEKNIQLPTKLSSDREDVADETISKAVNIEYEPEKYKIFAQQLSDDFMEIRDKLMLLPFSVCEHYDVQLTRYGTGGSYVLPQRVILNINTPRAGIGSFLHELVHIGIEHLIQRYQIQQSAKERLVDLIGIREFPAFTFEQLRFANQPHIDETFSARYPDLEGIFREIKNPE